MTMTADDPIETTPETASETTVEGAVHSVTTALDVLDCFQYDEELGVTEIARRLGIAKSTAHRLLSSLCARGFTEKIPGTGHYQLGLHLYELGQLAQDRLPTRHLALPVLEELRVGTGQTVHLSMAEGADVIFIERLQTLRGIPLLGERHRRMPLHTTSAGKVLAAFNPDIADAAERAGFSRMTEQTVHDRRAWQRLLAEVRQRGYAVSDSENRAGLASVAAPILQANGRATYAVSVAGPSEAIMPHAESLARVVTLAAQRISRRIGFR